MSSIQFLPQFHPFPIKERLNPPGFPFILYMLMDLRETAFSAIQERKIGNLMKEIELKAQYDSLKRLELEQYLKEQGFQEVRSFTQQDEYFNHPERDFQKTDEALRIRREQRNDGTSHCCITYKGANDSLIGQSRRELETRVEDEHKMRQILLALGFRSAVEVKKRRKEYKKEDLTVCLDELDGLGNYIELEVVLPETESKSATENRLRKFLSELSFIRPVIEPLTYLELVMGFREGSAAENASPND